MPDIFFISDLHLGHLSVLKWRDGPFTTLEEHDELIIDRWNSTIGKRDVVYVLGDVAFNQQGLKSLSRLRGIKHLILGNHDRYLRDFHIKFFNRINGAQTFKNDFLLTHVPVHPRSVRPRFQFNIHGHTHDQPSFGKEYINVCVEQVDFTPKPFEDIKEEIGYESMETLQAT